MIFDVIERVRTEHEVDSVIKMEIPDDLEVNGNPCTLERGLHDLITWGLLSIGPDVPLSIRGCRRKEGAMREALERSTLRPVDWLAPECREVVEIALPVAGEMQPEQEDRSMQDVASLCVPWQDGHPGIILLPGIVRQHGGAMLAERMTASHLLFRLWLPMSSREAILQESVVGNT